MSCTKPNDAVYDEAWNRGYVAARMAMLMWFQGVLQECINAAGQYDDTRSVQNVLRQVQDKLVEEF